MTARACKGTSSARVSALLLAWLMLSACSEKSELGSFSSDGCSLFPDASVISGSDWCSCCFEHDLAYWRGGTQAERVQADEALRNCILEKTDNSTLADVMYEGVKFGGSPYFYNWYRWGYGWGYDRKYQPLSSAELKRADELERQYLATPTDGSCR